MSRLDELNQQYSERFGEGWDREQLSESEYIEYLDAAYDYYENYCQRRDVLGGPYSDATEKWYGHPFEIVERVSVDNRDYDWITLPLWIIRIPDMEGGPQDPGEFAAYPEELFIEND